MEIKIKCRINSLKKASKKGAKGNMTADVTICDEFEVCNKNFIGGLDSKNGGLVLFNSKIITLIDTNDFFDFISTHVREELMITIDDNQTGATSSVVNVGNNQYNIVEVELIYG